MKRHGTLAKSLDLEAYRNREVDTATIRGARGVGGAIVQADECGETYVVSTSGRTTSGPGSTVTTVGPRDQRGRPRRQSAQVLPSQPPGLGGASNFPELRRSETDAPPGLTVTVPKELIPGETTEVVFVGVNLSETPLTEIVAVSEADVTVDDPRVTLANAAWVEDPSTVGVDPRYDAITADVTLDSDTVPGSLIFYGVEA